MVSRVLLATADLTLGEFACAPGDRLWHEVNEIGGRAHVVFPRTHVLIAQDGAHPILATPNHVVFYKPHQLYRRGLRDARGDRSLWLEIGDELPDGPPAAPTDAGRVDLAVGSYTANDGAPGAGRVDVRSGRTGAVLRTITSTTENENLGFDVVGVGDVNHDRRLDLLVSAAEGDTVYLIAG